MRKSNAEKKYGVQLTEVDVTAIKESCAHAAGSRSDFVRLQAGNHDTSIGSPSMLLKGSPTHPKSAVLSSSHSSGVLPQFSTPPEKYGCV